MRIYYKVKKIKNNTMNKKIFSIIALLCMAVSGAWAQDVELLTTILNKDNKTFKSGSQTFDDKVTVTFSAAVTNEGDSWGWYSYDGVTLSVTPAEGYTITSCRFYCNSGNALDETKPFEAVLGGGGYHTFVNGSNIGDWGVTKIEVYGYKNATIIPTPTANKNEWTFEMPAYRVKVNVAYDTDLALSEADDNATALEDWDGYEANVTLTRTLQTGGWNTLALPFSASGMAFATQVADLGITAVKELASSTLENGVLTLNFQTATSLVAGKPYLVKVANNVATPTFTGVEVSKKLVPTETTAVDFIPSLGLTEVTGDTKEILFLSSGNKLLYPKELPSAIKGFRAYFKLKGEAVNARSFSLNLGDGETTGIVSIDNGQLTIDNEIYDLTGRRVNSTAKKGVYVVKGKKVIK